MEHGAQSSENEEATTTNKWIISTAHGPGTGRDEGGTTCQHKVGKVVRSYLRKVIRYVRSSKDVDPALFRWHASMVVRQKENKLEGFNQLTCGSEAVMKSGLSFRWTVVSLG